MLHNYRDMPPVLAHLLSAVFLVLAGFILYLGTSMCMEVYNARAWVETPAERLNASKDPVRDPKRRSGEPTVRISGDYAYTWQGTRYESHRIELASGTNNFSKERQALQWERLNSDAVQVYVNPENPAESVLDRSFPAPLMAFYTIFLIMPCMVGIVWLWSLPLAWVREDRQRTARKWSYAGIAATLVYFPTLAILLFAAELETAQWIIFAATYGLVGGVCYWLANRTSDK